MPSNEVIFCPREIAPRIVAPSNILIETSTVLPLPVNIADFLVSGINDYKLMIGL